MKNQTTDWEDIYLQCIYLINMKENSSLQYYKKYKGREKKGFSFGFLEFEILERHIHVDNTAAEKSTNGNLAII